jgi:hypothetical protein
VGIIRVIILHSIWWLDRLKGNEWFRDSDCPERR